MTVATMTAAERRTQLENELASEARAQREARIAAFREADRVLQAAYEERAELERQLEDGELAREAERLCLEWNELLRDWQRPETHWQPPQGLHDPGPEQWQKICQQRAEASRRDEQRLIEIKAAERRYSVAVERTVEAKARFATHEIHEEIKSLEREAFAMREALNSREPTS
jgi:hypothetical protein